ncbi:hypothetical protein KM043_013208 [Ampulex compressa]|nr:hypothetical protein KM043_013208 [Ampulex compressa]
MFEKEGNLELLHVPRERKYVTLPGNLARPHGRFTRSKINKMEREALLFSNTFLETPSAASSLHRPFLGENRVFLAVSRSKRTGVLYFLHVHLKQGSINRILKCKAVTPNHGRRMRKKRCWHRRIQNSYLTFRPGQGGSRVNRIGGKICRPCNSRRTVVELRCR